MRDTSQEHRGKAERCGPVRRSRRSRWRAASLILVHLAIIAHLAHWKLQGSTLTPLEPSEAMETLELGYVNAGFLFFALLILSTLVFGRFFCGWACHVVAYQDLCSWLLKKAGLRPRPLRSRLLVLVPFGVAFYMFAWPQLERMVSGGAAPGYALQLTTESFWETFPGPWIAALTLLVDGALVVYLMGAKGFCTYGCPYGAFFGLADRLAPGRIRVDESCDGCGHCTIACSSNVRVHEEVARHGAVVDPGCMKCLDCVSVCPMNALRFDWGKPSLLSSWRGARRPRRGALRWSEELLMAAAFLVGLIAFRGLYDLVPLLLAVGLGVVNAFAALTGWRLLREGRLARGGRLTAAALGLWFVFLAHSGWVHYHAWRGTESLERAMEETEHRGELLEEARAHLETALSGGLYASARLHHQLGSIFYTQGNVPAALDHLERSLRKNPRAYNARMLYARVLAQGDRRRMAEEQLRRVIEEREGWAEPLLPLAKLLIRRGAFAEAEEVLLKLGELQPDHPELERWLELVRRSIKGSR